LRLRRERLTDDGAVAIVLDAAVSADEEADLVFRFGDFPPPVGTAALFSQMGARAGISEAVHSFGVMYVVECNGDLLVL
jgi:hypothetical protein